MKPMSSTFKKTLLSSLIVPFTLGATAASAQPITEWAWSVDSSFGNYTQTEGEGSVTETDENGVNTLTWGINGEESSISISDASAPGGLFTNGDFVQGGTFTHNNQILPEPGAALDTFDLTSALTLTPVDPANESYNLDPITFDSFFIETLNANGNCIPESESICDDIFTLNNLDELGFEEIDGNYQFVTPSFTYEDYAYTVYLDLVGLDPLSEEACTAAGASPGCVGFLTQEENVNEFITQFRIASTQVPEPGTLALLGMGLAGLGLARRKRAAKV